MCSSDITINGLVWMGSYDEMLGRLEEKLKEGFHCVKLKIGAINIYLRTWNDDNHLYLSVRDTGLGIKKENLKKVFDKFYRVHTGNVHDAGWPQYGTRVLPLRTAW